MSTIICFRAIREDIQFHYFAFDFHCVKISQGAIFFLNFDSQSVKSHPSVASSHRVRHYSFNIEHKMFNIALSSQPSEAKIAQVLNLPRVFSAVPIVSTLSIVLRCNSFSFNEASGVALWGASHFMFGRPQYLSGDLTVNIFRFSKKLMSRTSNRHTLGHGQALYLLASADVFEPRHARTVQDLALKVFTLVTSMETV
jgi:hypothetical protein